jgi:hypothetical protein
MLSWKVKYLLVGRKVIVGYHNIKAYQNNNLQLTKLAKTGTLVQKTRPPL